MAAKVVWCLTINHENEADGTPFEVDFKNDTSIGNLKKRVKTEKQPDLDHLAADRLRIWRCTDRTTTLNRKNLNAHIRRLFRDEGVEELDEREKVADLAVPVKETLLVRIPKDGERKRKRKRDESSEEVEAQQVRTRLSKFAKLTLSSLAAEPSKFEGNAKDLVDYTRPFDFGTIPITLLQREMAEFKDDCESVPPAEAQTLTLAACKRHMDETARRSEVQQVFRPPRDCTYPYPTIYVDEAGREVDFEYAYRVPGKLVFSARAKGLGAFIVKFVRRYSAEAHRFLASFNYAPRLRAAPSIPGGWTMVVMDFSPHRVLCDPDLALSVDAQKRVVSRITHVVKTLHKGGFVHGDVRHVNILIDDRALASNGDFTVHLLDFDWAGRIGEVKYPSRVNTSSVTRPKGVTDGANITEEHDLAMIEKLF